MSCINKNHPDVAKLAGELNILPAVAAAKIGVWQEKNNNFDRFPTKEELILSNKIIYNGIFNPNNIYSFNHKTKEKTKINIEGNKKIIYISPDNYLKLVNYGLNNNIINQLIKSKADNSIIEKYKNNIKNNINDNLNENSRLSIKNIIDNNEKLDIPFIFFDENGKMTDQDGRNRSNYAKELGENLIPVAVENLPDNILNNKVFETKKDLSEFVDETGLTQGLIDKDIDANDELNNNLKYANENNKILFNNKQGKFTVDEILENILNNYKNLSSQGKDLLQKSRRLIGRTGTQVRLVGKEVFSKDALMHIRNTDNIIEMSRDIINKYPIDYVIEGFIHEIAHGQSLQALMNPQTFEEKEFEDLIFRKYYKYWTFQSQKQINKNGNYDDKLSSYGFKNEKEFVAEIYSNSAFRDELRELDRMNETSYWKQFIEAVRRLFGISKSKEANLLIEQVIDFIEVDRRDYKGVSNQKLLIFEKNIQPENIELDTIEKQLQHTVNQAKDRITQLIKRTKAAANVKNKEEHKNFIKSFEALLDEIVLAERNNKWKSIISYAKSFSSAVSKLNNSLNKALRIGVITHNDIIYHKEQFDLFRPASITGKYIIAEDIYELYKNDPFIKELVKDNNLDINDDLYNTLDNLSTKDLDTFEMLKLVDSYEEYLSAYDLLDEINSLITRSQNDKTLERKDKVQIEEIKKVLHNLKDGHQSLTDSFINIKKAFAVTEFSKPENNTKVVTEWKDKLFSEHAKLNIKSETKEEYFGRMIETKYKSDYQNALRESARKIVYDPYFDISTFDRNTTDILNINSPLINLISNTIGKMRDNIINAYHDKQFQLNKIFKKYSKEKGQNKQSEMYGNIIELSQNDQYYLKGEYSTKFLDSVQNELYPILDKITELKEKYSSQFDTKKEALKALNKDAEYKTLKSKRKAWFSVNTISINEKTVPHPKYKNAEVTGVEKELLDYFKSETDNNNVTVYNNHVSLVKSVYGAKFYKIPSVTKSNLERTLEGDVKGQLKDKWTDLTEVKVDDVNYGEAVDSKNKEKRTVKIGFRGKLDSKDQSLDLFTVYRKEALNAINYKEKKSNEIKLKLFVDIASSKEYKKRSIQTGKWLQNKYATHAPGTTFSGEFSQELKKIEGLLETHLYDVLSYSGGKVFGSKLEASKLASMVNGFAANIAMTANLGSGVVNVLNGVTQMFLTSAGGYTFNKTDLLKAEAHYSKNIMNILADLNQPVKQSFHNQMLDMFDIFGGFDSATQEFIRNSYAKKIISTHSMNGLNEMGEHMMNAVLTESILRGIKVMNSERKYINKEGIVVEELNAASLFDMLSLNSDGKLVMSDKVVYTKKNIDSKYHEGGKQHINYVIKKKAHDIFGVYDPLMKAEIAKTWWGKTLMMFKNFFLSSLKHRYKGIETSLTAKEDLTEDDISFNNAEQEFTEGIYTTFIRFISQGVIPSLKGLQLAYMIDNYNSLSDYEKANLKNTTLEICLTMVILPLLGMMIGAAAGDDDNELFFAMYAFRRLESELSQFRNPMELQRMIANPVAANRFIQNCANVVNDIVTPINFNPQRNETFFDYFSEDSKHNNVLVKHVKKITPFYAQLDKEYKNLYNLLNK